MLNFKWFDTYTYAAASYIRFVTLVSVPFFFFSPETKRMQEYSRQHIRNILDEKKKLNDKLELKMKNLKILSENLAKKEALTELERQKLDEEKKKVMF